MRGARPESVLEQTIERGGVVRRGDRIVVACSGGADSVALAGALTAVATPMELSLALAYVHHGTRDSAWQDECVVLGVGVFLGLAVRVAALASAEGAGRSEAALREARYAALAAIARDCGASVVATGHHGEDQSETVLLALLRGTGLDGLGGMRPRRPLERGIELVRPCLGVSGDVLRYYCHVRGLPYAVDPTNADAGLRRNAVRRSLRDLRPTFPGLDAAVARTAELIGAENDGSERARYRREVRRVLEAGGEMCDVDFLHIEAAAKALETGGSGRFHMKAGLELRIERGRVAGLERQ